MVSKFPEVIPVVKQFVEHNDLQADLKRGSEQPFLYGTTTKAAKEEVLAKVPEVAQEFPKFSECITDS